MAKPGCRCITWPTHFLRAAGRTPSFLQREGRCCRQGFLWQRRDREKGEVHSDPMFPGWLAALLLHHLLASAAYDAGGVPPEQLLPLHAKACQGQGRSSTGHDTSHTVMHTPLHTAVWTAMSLPARETRDEMTNLVTRKAVSHVSES